MADCGIPLPCESTVSSGLDALKITNTGDGAAVAASATGRAVTAESADGAGVVARSVTGNGVLAVSTSGNGVRALSASNHAVSALSVGTSGFVPPPAGVVGESSTGHGVVGSSAAAVGVMGRSDTDDGVVGLSRTDVGVIGDSAGEGFGYGVAGSCAPGFGVFGFSSTGTGAFGFSDSGVGVGGSVNRGTGVWGSTSDGGGVLGTTIHGTGVSGTSSDGTGVAGRSSGGLVSTGVFGESHQGGFLSAGVFGASSGSGAGAIGVYGRGGEGGSAGFFDGDVHVFGALSKAGGGFRIDHPVEPANKFLSHSFVESSEMKNVYDGIATLDGNGEGCVDLPDWFDALNDQFRYQLTAIGAPGPDLHISQEISNNRFCIAGGKPGMKVSWQVTGIRSDSWAKAHPVMVEKEKPEDEKGYYQNPELYDQAPENSTLWRGNSELRRRPEEPPQDASRLDVDQVREQVRTLTDKVRKHRTQPPAGGE